ncbi:unnamed protein product [Phytomonas sp. EM1]|nr:unnamed protein product [Phytomonas sp. EM1]|eukprot:CCW59840.1 unnamed protein product [Phytomonas sp. isolate EM1]
MLWSPEVKALTGDQRAASTTSHTDNGNHDDEERCACMEGCDAGNLVTSNNVSTSVASLEELTQDRTPNSAKVNSRMLDCQSNAKSLSSVKNGVGDDVDKAFPQKTVPEPTLLMPKEEHCFHSDVDAPSTKSSQILNALKGHDETQVTRGNDTTEEEEAESDSGSEFEWKPVKCSKTRENEIEWGAKDFSIQQQEKCHDDNGKHSVKRLDDVNSEEEDKEGQQLNIVPSLSPSLSTQAADGVISNEVKGKHGADRLFPRPLLFPLEQERNSMQYRTGSPSRSKKKALPRPHSGKHRLPASEMDDAMYLMVFGIDKLLSNLAMALLEHKPMDHKSFAKKWIEHLVDMGRKGERKEGIERPHSLHFHHNYCKRVRGKHCGSPGVLNLASSGSALPPTGYAVSTADVVSPRGNQLTKRRLKEVLKTELDSKRGSCDVNEHRSFQGVSKKPEQGQNKAGSRGSRSEFRRECSHDSENSDKGNLKKRRCLSKAKISDKVNDYLSKVELTRVPPAAGGLTIAPVAAMADSVDTPSSLKLGTLATEDYKADGTLPSPKSKKSWSSFRSNNFVNNLYSPAKDVSITDDGKGNDSKSLLSGTVDPNLIEIRSSSNAQATVCAVGTLPPAEPLNAALINSPIAVGSHETVSSREVECEEGNKEETGSGEYDKIAEANLFALSPISNSCFGAPQNDGSEVALSSLKNETRVGASKIDSFSSSTLLPNLKGFDRRGDEDPKEDNGDIDNALVTFAPVITLDQSTSGVLGGVRVSNENKAGSFNSLSLPPTSGQPAAASTASNLLASPGINAGREAVTNTRGSRLTSATADIPAKLLAAIAPTTISNANRAAQQKLANSGITVPASGSTTSKLGGNTKIPLAATSTGSEANLASSRNTALNSGFNQGSTTATIGSARLKLHSLVGASDTMGAKSKLAFLRGTGEHSNPTLHLTPRPQSASTSASPLTLSRLQPHTLQPYNNGFGTALAANQNAAGGTIFPILQTSLYTPESTLDNKVDLVPFSSIEYAEKGTPRRENLPCKLSPAPPTDLFNSSGVGGVCTRGIAPFTGSEGEAQVMMIAAQNSLTDVDAPSPRVSSMSTGGNTALAMGSSSSTGFNFSPMNSLMKRRGDSILASESGGVKVIPDRFLTPTESFLAPAPSEVLTRINNTLGQIPKAMYSKVLSFLEGLVGKTEGGDTDGSGFSLLNNTNGATGFHARASFQPTSQNATTVNFSEAMCSAAYPIDAALRYQERHNRPDSIPYQSERLKTLPEMPEKSSGMRHAWSSPTLSTTQCEEVSATRCGTNPLSENSDTHQTLEIGGHSPPAEVGTNTQARFQVNRKSGPTQSVAQSSPLGHDTAMASCGRTLGLQSSIRAFASSIAPYSQSQAAISMSPLSRGQSSLPQRPVGVDPSSPTIETISEKTSPFLNYKVKSAVQTAHSPFSMNCITESLRSCNKEEGASPLGVSRLRETNKCGFEAPDKAIKLDQPIGEDHSLEENTTFDASLTPEIEPFTSQSVMTQMVHTATGAGVSESECKNTSQQINTECDQEREAEEGFQNNTHGEVTTSLKGNNDGTDNFNDSERYGEGEKCEQLSTDQHPEVITHQSQDSVSKQNDGGIPSNQLAHTDLNEISGDEQITIKEEQTQPQRLQGDGALIDSSRPPENKGAQSGCLQTTDGRIHHQSGDTICIPFNNSALKDWLSTEPECIILSSGDSQLAATYDGIDLPDIREPDNSWKLSRSAPIVYSKCSENGSNSAGRSPASLARSFYFPPIGPKHSHHCRHNRYHSDTPKKSSYHRSHRHYRNHHKKISNDAIHHHKGETGDSKKLKLSGSGSDQSQAHDSLEHEPSSECETHSQHTETVDVGKPDTPLCQSYISDSNAFPNKTADQITTSKKRQSRSVSLNFGNTIYTFPKFSMSGEGSHSTNSSKMKRSLSAVLHTTQSMHAEEDIRHRKRQECRQRAHSKCNPSSFSDQLSEEGHEYTGGKTTANFPYPKGKKFSNDLHSHGKCVPNLPPCHLSKTARSQDRTSSQSRRRPFCSKDLERSLLERTMEFMNRRGHLDTPNYAGGDFHEPSTSVRSSLYASGDMQNRSPNAFVRGQSEKSMVHDPKLDYAIAMTALAVAEGELSSLCSSATSSDRLLNVADLIYSKQVQLSVNKEDCSRSRIPSYSHGVLTYPPQFSGPLSITDGADVTAHSVAAIKTINEESVSHAEGEEENICRSSQNTCNREILSDFTFTPDLPADAGGSTSEKFAPLSPKVSSSSCAEIRKGLLEESAITATTDFTLKDLSISSEEFDSLREAISQSSILTAFDSKQIGMLIHAMTRKVLKVNDILVREGEQWVGSLIFVINGSLSAIGHENISQELGAGSLYGEVEFFENVKRSLVTLVSATAPTVTVFLLANKDLVSFIMSQKRVLKIFLTKYIGRIPLFQTCPDPIKRRIAEALKPHRIEQGTTLIDQGSPVEWLYIVLSGDLTLTFFLEKARKERSKHSKMVCKPFSSPLLSSGPSLKRYTIPSKESLDQYYRNTSVPEHIDDMEQGWESHIQTSQHSIDDTVYLISKNDPRDSTRVGTDSPVPYSSDSSEDAKSTGSPHQFSALSLPTSIFVDNKKLSTVISDFNAVESGITADQPGSQLQHEKEETEGLQLPLDAPKGQFLLKCSSGSLVGEVELVFATKSLFTARATTTLQVARISRLHFDIIMDQSIIDIFKRVIVVHPIYRFLRKVAPKKMRIEMNSIGLNQAIGESRKSESRMKTGSSLSSIRWFDGQDDKGSNATSQHRQATGKKISKLASVEQLPHFRKMSSIDKLSHLKGELQGWNKSLMNTATTSSHHSHVQSNENTRASKGNITSGTFQRSYRSSNIKRTSTGASLWHRISPDGEIVFSGGRHLCRFPLEALCANNTIVIEIIMDGTIIHWNPIAHHVIGYAPFEVIGQNIFDLMSCEENRQKLQTMLKAAKEYAGKWESYVAAELNLQKIFSFRQNTGLYQIGVALSVIPSMCSSFSEVFLLVGRESKYHAAANYSADVVAWLNERMRPQLANFQYYVSYIESKKWMVTPNDAILLRGHLDACMVTVEHLARLSLLTMETVRDSLRPTQLIIPIRRFMTEACALVRKKNCSLFCKTDDITPNVKVFLDAEKVIMFLRLLLKDLLKSMEYDPTMHVDIELRVMIIEPESTHFGQQLPQNAAQQKRLRQSPQQQAQDHNESGVNSAGSPGVGISSAGEGNHAFSANPSIAPQSGKTPASSSEGPKPSTGVVPQSNAGDSKESKSSIAHTSPPLQSASSVSPASNAEHGDGIDLQLSSLRRICFELHDNGLTIPLFHSSNDMAKEFPGVDSFDSAESFSKSFIQTVLSPVSRFGHQEATNQVAPFNSPVVSNTAAQHFPHGNASGGSLFPNPRHRGGELAHVEKIVSEMGGMLRCFTRPEVEGNVVRVELPLLAVPGSKEEVVEDARTLQHVAPGGRSFTVIVADSNHVHQNHLCQILWSRQHAVIPVRSFEELMRKIKSNTADILIIDPIQIDLNMDGYIKTHGSDPFSDILESTSRMVLVVVGMDFSDWRVQKLLDRNSVIEVPKLGSAALIHIAMQEAEQMVAEMRDEEARIEQLRSNFTNSAAGRHKVGRLLGKGTFGDVYEVKDTLTSGKMAMKRMQLHEGTVVDEVVQEILAMTSLQHDNIIRYFYCEKESDTTLRLYMELAPEGTLRDRIREHPGVGLPFEEIVQRLTGVCRGLAYVHAQHYVHCDLKTANLLLGTHGRTKIGDFGTAKQLAPGQKLYKLLGTPQYMAPEVLMADVSQQIGYDYKADVWSVGCIALEMATGLPPFSHIEQSHGMGIIKYLSELTDTPDLSPLFSGNPLIYEFVKACLEINPEHRPSAQELLHFDILQGMGTSIRAERIMRRAEMLYKLNKYASKRGDNKERSSGTFAEGDSDLTDTTNRDGDILGAPGAVEGHYKTTDSHLRSSVSSSSLSESRFTSTSDSESALSSNWSVESLQPTISSKNM